MGIEEVKNLLMEKLNLGPDFDFSSAIKMIEQVLGKPISQIADPSAIASALQQGGGLENLTSMLEGDGKPGFSLDDVMKGDSLKKIGSLLGGKKD